MKIYKRASSEPYHTWERETKERAKKTKTKKGKEKKEKPGFHKHDIHTMHDKNSFRSHEFYLATTVSEQRSELRGKCKSQRKKKERKKTEYINNKTKRHKKENLDMIADSFESNDKLMLSMMTVTNSMSTKKIE